MTTATDSDSVPTNSEPAQCILDFEMLQDARSPGNPLTVNQLRALLSFSDRGTQSPQGLAEQLQVEPSVIDRLCSQLIRRGFLIQIPHGSSDDASAIVLSTAGQRFVAHLRYRNGDAFRRTDFADPHEPQSEWRNDEAIRPA